MNDPPAGGGWGALKSSILEKLNIEEEYEALGLRWEKNSPRGGNEKGVRRCHAIDREDKHASACVFLKSGVYHDSGGAMVNLGFFDFALKYGESKFGRWIDVVRHYGDKVGVETFAETVSANPSGRVVEAIYKYQDAKGVLRYGVFRHRNPDGSKSFSQHPWLVHTWGYGSSCMAGLERFPYRLPQMLAYDGQPVLVVEGEKDVDRLEHFGYVATTSPGGVGNVKETWHNPAFVGWFKDRDVVLIPDNDIPGLTFMQLVGRALHGIAHSIRFVRLPGVPAKGDVSDWLDMGNDANDLFKLIQDVDLWDPSQAPQEGPQETPGCDPDDQALSPIIWASQVVTRPVQWLWPGRVPLGKQTTLAGPGGTGKTFFLCDLASRVSAGLEWPFSNGECANVGNVLYVSGEDDPDDTLVPRMIEQGADLSRIAFFAPQELINFNLAGPAFRKAADKAIDAMGGCCLIIIDPPSSFLHGIDENSNAEVRGILTPMKEWASQHNTAIIFNAHVNKGNGKKIEVQTRVMGSVAWVNGPRFSHMVTISEDDPEVRLFVPLKTNIWKKTKALKFRINQTDHLAKLEWLGELDIDADEAVNGIDESQKDESKKETKEEKIETWLISRFKEKAIWPTQEIAEKFRNELSLQPGSTFHRVKDELGIKSRRYGKSWEMFVTDDWVYGLF